jgi:hypothetical protein
MDHSVFFKAYGHPNISARHKTTLMITKDNYLTIRGDCVVGIGSEKGLLDFPKEFKEAVKDDDATIILVLGIDELSFIVTGRGHSDLAYSHPFDIVSRKSDYICDRTLMVESDKAASDIDPRMLRLLTHIGKPINIAIHVKL